MSFSFEAIDHVQLAAPKGSEEKARQFFNEILGFTELEKPDVLKKRGGVWFALGPIIVHIGIEEPFVPAKKAHPAFEVEHIEELKKHLKKNNIQYKEDDQLPGANRMYVNDPFGNRLEFLEWNKDYVPNH
ncbi:VOC family protein [Halalkalibacter okhensis]|uniref:Glyoxalase n=1 Tax=Halalkalibacter okhensis TaxID=333138 RepID=A0A0B0IF73_9BACI|nr:VOC family protein [Halalkalibacter okhensis]KHF39930.1 glyoxalase [Halalkalibacter okhensis]